MPDRLSWLRPFAMTGALTLEHPLAGVSTNIGIDPQSGQLAAMPTAAVDTLHWGSLDPVQHLLPQQPLYAWQAPQGRAPASVYPAR